MIEIWKPVKNYENFNINKPYYVLKILSVEEVSE